MKVGQLLKQYRREKNLTQKQMAAGIISPSFYAKVEKGQHEINATDFLAILQVQEIDLIEFMQKYNLSQESSSYFEQYLEQLVERSYYAGDGYTLHQLQILLLNNNDRKKSKQLLLKIKLLLAIMKEDTSQLSITEQQDLKEQIFNLPNNKLKLELYCNAMKFYDFDSKLLLSRNLIAKFDNNNDLNIQKVILAIINNMV
ncbi:XRE family transcriptional regulator, partial [Lactobacillus sp. XV13L]|nr:XRE family transcriptional regulator [Lactobacillus sp. XV13L]